MRKLDTCIHLMITVFFFATLISVGNNPDLILSKKSNCLKETEKYRAENVNQFLLKKLVGCTIIEDLSWRAVTPDFDLADLLDWEAVDSASFRNESTD